MFEKFASLIEAKQSARIAELEELLLRVTNAIAITHNNVDGVQHE